jgi:uncharacterized lipoprotein YbaY
MIWLSVNTVENLGSFEKKLFRLHYESQDIDLQLTNIAKKRITADSKVIFESWSVYYTDP